MMSIISFTGKGDINPVKNTQVAMGNDGVKAMALILKYVPKYP